jgi:hypothetical protein
MSDEIKPAMTSEEWERFLRQGMRGVQPLRERFENGLPKFSEDWHALAALALYRESFGFNHALLAHLREIEPSDRFQSETIRRVADRIAALLPPAPP